MRLATQTAVLCVCFQRRRVRHNANYVPDRRAFACKERNLHCDVHVAAENKHSLPPFGSLESFWIRRSQRPRRRETGLLLKAPLHDPIRSCGACRLPCTSANRVACHSNVPNRWKSADKELQPVLFSSRYCRTCCAIIQSERSKHLKRPSPYSKASRVACMNAPKCAHLASKHLRIL